MVEWPSITQEELPWDRSSDIMELIPKSRRRRISATYLAAMPPTIANLPAPSIPQDLLLATSETALTLARFDAAQGNRPYSLPALMLRSESASSSQIEKLTSSIKNVALAEIGGMAPSNAEAIAGNVEAMRKAVSIPEGKLSMPAICDMHAALMRGEAGEHNIRNEQVWIGGTPYSPHDAAFVPPHHSRVPALLEDLIAFTERIDIDPIVKLALAHAQFETIHPFTDGNGRTGRAMFHAMAAQENLLKHSVLPISAGLLHNVNEYMQAITAYQQGNAEPIIRALIDALELAVAIGQHMSLELDTVLIEWESRITERKGSAMRRLTPLLVQQPVVNVKYLAKNLVITERAALNLAERACEYGILKRMGNAKRGVFYQAPELIDVLEETASQEGIRRLLCR